MAVGDARRWPIDGLGLPVARWLLGGGLEVQGDGQVGGASWEFLRAEEFSFLENWRYRVFTIFRCPALLKFLSFFLATTKFVAGL